MDRGRGRQAQRGGVGWGESVIGAGIAGRCVSRVVRGSELSFREMNRGVIY